jgi:hypothetical protein
MASKTPVSFTQSPPNGSGDLLTAAVGGNQATIDIPHVKKRPADDHVIVPTLHVDAPVGTHHLLEDFELAEGKGGNVAVVPKC